MTDLPKGKSEARTSVFLVAFVLGMLAAWNGFHRHRLPLAEVLGGIATVLLLVGLLSPSLTRKFHRAWMRLAAGLGYVNSRIFLSIVFYLMVTPFGAIMRLFGRDPLRRRSSLGQGYWVPRAKPRQTSEEFERSF